jgi:arsenate reductase
VEKTRVHPLAITVMKEIGIDISQQRSQHIEEFQDKKFDYVITVCDQARETCPFFPGNHVIHKSFQDPALVQGSIKEKLKAFRKVRDEIKEWILTIFCTEKKKNE